MPNKFPAFGPWSDEGDRGGLFAKRSAIGRQEVVVHSPRHVRSLTDLSTRELGHVVEAWQARAAAAREDGFPYVHLLVNEGRLAGASLPHSHSQLVWLREEPPLVTQELREQEASEGCLACELVRSELDQRIRIVDERDGAVLLCPFAGRQPYEMLVIPAACDRDPFTSDLLEPAFGLVREGLRRLRAAEGSTPLNLWLHAAGHWHVEILPRLSILAGLELGAGYYVNTLAPESAAGVLREA